MATEAHGVSFPNSNSHTVQTGCKITIGSTAVTIDSITQHASNTSTMGYIYDSTMSSQLASASMSGGTATFATPYQTSANTSYYLIVDSSGGSYTRRFGDATLPVTGTYLNWVDGWNGGDTTGELFSVISCVVSIPNVTITPSALTMTTSLQAPVNVIIQAPSAQTLSISLQGPFVSSTEPTGTVEVGSGTKGTRFVKEEWPITSGLETDSKHEGRKISLEPVKSLVKKGWGSLRR